MAFGVLPKLIEEVRRFGVEIAVRHGWVGFALARQESPDVPAVFLQQGPAEILWMSLEMNEEALLFLFDKQIDAGFRRLGENSIAARGERIFPNLVPAGMRKAHRGACAVCQWMLAKVFVIENAELFVG